MTLFLGGYTEQNFFGSRRDLTRIFRYNLKAILTKMNVKTFGIVKFPVFTLLHELFKVIYRMDEGLSPKLYIYKKNDYKFSVEIKHLLIRRIIEVTAKTVPADNRNNRNSYS